MKTPLSLKSILTLIIVALGLQSAALAATLQIEAMVPGYKNPVKVIIGSNTGGRVIRAANGTYYTDRVARGEKCRYSATAQPGDYFPSGQALIGTNVYYGNAYSIALPWGTYPLPYTSPWFGILNNAAADNYTIVVLTYAGRVETKIPLGRR